MKKKSKAPANTTLISIAITFVIYIGAVIIYLYANGWRIDPFNSNVLQQTGVITVESTPSLSDLYLDGKNKGKTPKSLSLNVGTYDLTVSKDGYFSWSKTVEVKEEKSTPVFPWLIKSSVSEAEEVRMEETFVDSWLSYTKDRLIFLTMVTNDDDTYTYNLWDYNINKVFWDLTENPLKITSINTEDELDIDLNLSRNGELAILSTEIDDEQVQYIVDTKKYTNWNDLTALDLADFPGYTITWSEDGNYLMLESEEDLISLDVDRDTRYLLQKKSSDNLIWTTDSEGFIYLLEENKDTDLENVYVYNLIQKRMDGSNTKTIVENMYFQKELNYIDSYRENRKDLQDYICDSFSTSPECTQSIGYITGIDVNHDAKGVYITTNAATYWYNMEENKYIMISPYTSEVIRYTEEKDKLLLRDETGVHVFTFDKEEADHTTDIGTKTLNNIENFSNTSNFRWMEDSIYLSYFENDNMYIADKDGDNKVKVIENVSEYDNLVTKESQNDIIGIYSEDFANNQYTVIKLFNIN